MTMFHVKREPIPPAYVSRETREKLALFETEVCRWAGTINLLARGDLLHLSSRHIADSLQILALLPEADGGAFVDVGSGGGFPGLVLAIASGRMFHLVEADHRKAAFLRDAARICGASVQVHAERMESTALPPVRIATARAVAPLTRLLGWVQPRLRADGECLFMKGRTAGAELAIAQTEWNLNVRCWVSRTDDEATILQISGVTPRV